MIVPTLLNTTVNVFRRASTGRDSLNNPVYGKPTDGAGWTQIYTNMPVRLAFHANNVRFDQTGERPIPNGVAYISPNYQINVEDRIVTTDSQTEYVVTSVVTGYLLGSVVDHYELLLGLP